MGEKNRKIHRTRGNSHDTEVGSGFIDTTPKAAQ